MEGKMKTIRVAAAVICDDMDHPSRIFATAKGYGEFKGQWEVPGGKIEAGEAADQGGTGYGNRSGSIDPYDRI